MKKILLITCIIIGLYSCKKDEEKTPTPVTNSSTIVFTDVYVLDSIVQINSSGYADTIKVTAERTVTTAPSMYGKNNNTTVEGTYQTWGDYYSFSNDLQHDGNPNSGISGFYSFRGDTLDYVYTVDNSTLNPNHKALYVKIP